MEGAPGLEFSSHLHVKRGRGADFEGSSPPFQLQVGGVLRVALSRLGGPHSGALDGGSALLWASHFILPPLTRNLLEFLPTT